MTIAGIDIDSNSLHIVRLNLDDDTARYDRVRLDTGEGDYHVRAQRARDLLPARDAWKDDGVVQIAIEEPRTPPPTKAGKSGGGFKAAIPQAVIRGALLACLPRPHEVPLLIMPPQEWKLWSLGGGKPGKGNAKKDEIADWARAHWADMPSGISQDGFDAFCVAWAARALLNHHATKGVTP